MLARIHRFHGHNSLRFVYGNGKTVRSPMMALKFASNPRRQTYRAAVVVSKKNNKLAVVRNRIRRRVYEAVRQYTPEACRLDMVFTVFSDQLAAVSSEELYKIIRSLLQGAGAEQGPPSPKKNAAKEGNTSKINRRHGIVKPKEP